MRAYLLVSGSIFAVVSLAHLLRVLLGWQAQLGEWVVPMWLSWPGFVVAGTLSATAFRLALLRT